MMKVSADPRDPNYWREHFSDLPVTVTLDDCEVHNVVYADDQAGIVEAFPIDYLVCECGEQVISRLLFGKVAIVGARRA
ncbi:hypothetical protein V5279_21290 [Bradyrhizobium sp. 26S5]|nr:hypothetical protein [Bradyrhizobium septentrionale]UGY23118.1 hypothetical protein HU675_0034945 [Bradyrhizobium septentrionale]